jgi:hypothetical protein
MAMLLGPGQHTLSSVPVVLPATCLISSTVRLGPPPDRDPFYRAGPCTRPAYDT